MSDKALLVMDMPESCVDCIFCFEIDEGTEACCTVTREQDNEDAYREIKEDYCQCKPYWCPLKPIPERVNLDGMRQEAIEEDCYDDTNGIDEAYLQGKETGWNACVDKILEGEEWPD